MLVRIPKLVKSCENPLGSAQGYPKKIVQESGSKKIEARIFRSEFSPTISVAIFGLGENFFVSVFPASPFPSSSIGSAALGNDAVRRMRFLCSTVLIGSTRTKQGDSTLNSPILDGKKLPETALTGRRESDTMSIGGATNGFVGLFIYR